MAHLYALEGANVAITYLKTEKKDAEQTRQAVEAAGGECLLLQGDLTEESFCKDAVKKTVKRFGGLDILVSNAAHQTRKDDIADITSEEFDRTFRTNIYAYFHLAKAAIPHMKPGSAIIATSSVTGMTAPKKLLDYSSTKGAINTFTQSLAQMLADKGIRVNAVAPGPVWTPLNPRMRRGSKTIREFGKDQPFKRPAQPEELAPAYVFLASDADSSHIRRHTPVTGSEPLY